MTTAALPAGLVLAGAFFLVAIGYLLGTIDGMRRRRGDNEMSKEQKRVEVFGQSGTWIAPKGACCFEVQAKGGSAGTKDGPGEDGAVIIITYWPGHQTGGCKETPR